MKEEKKKAITRTPRVRKEAQIKDLTDDKVINAKVKRTSKRRAKKDEIKEEITVIKKSVEFSLIEVIVIVLITGIVVSLASGLIVFNNYDRLTEKQTVSKSDLDEIYKHYNRILNEYVEEVDKEKLIDAAIAGMYNYLGDEYSMYLDQDSTSDFEEQLQGEYTGVGIEITTIYDDEKNPTIKINRVFKDSPAELSGMKAGDIITKVDGIVMKDANQVSSTIKGGKKDSYEITYIRDGKENTLTLTRKKVFINSVNSEVYGNVGYIKIDTFSSTIKSQLLKVLDGFDNKINSVVIDLRDNTGGYLDTAYDVANLFLEKGKIIYQLKDRNGKISSYKADNGVYRKFDKIVVLINGNSASASEILALALKESANATLVGTTSYGKGTVQETRDLKSGSMVKFTTSYWLSPKGNSINKKGIEPDIVEKEEEKQLEKALKVAK